MNQVSAYEYTTKTHLLVTDEDAADFLQSQFTNELRPFEVGQCTYGLWLDVKGKVLADSFVLCEGEEQFRLVSESSDAAVLKEKLERHIIADDVIIDAEAALTGFAFIGEDVGQALSALGLSLPDKGQFNRLGEYLIFYGRRAQGVSVELLCLSDPAALNVREALSDQGAVFLSKDTLNAMRIAAGFPLVPVEVGSADMPGEGGLEQDAVSFTKGCYLGQEVVARMHNVGRPQRSLYVIEGAGSIPQCSAVLSNEDAKTVGELRTAYQVGDNWQGVALLKHRFVSVGECLNLGDHRVKVTRTLRGVSGAAL
ncbi:MAG: YgfZ/GcvT domain-containing protein [Lentimonas sp.]